MKKKSEIRRKFVLVTGIVLLAALALTLHACGSSSSTGGGPGGSFAMPTIEF